jgi:hypothetical protein
MPVIPMATPVPHYGTIYAIAMECSLIDPCQAIRRAIRQVNAVYVKTSRIKAFNNELCNGTIAPLSIA